MTILIYFHIYQAGGGIHFHVSDDNFAASFDLELVRVSSCYMSTLLASGFKCSGNYLVPRDPHTL